MEHVGMDLGRKQSHVAWIGEDGAIVHERLRTTPQQISERFLGSKRVRVLMEASGSSEWVARLLESFGHEVIVADPNFAPMYGQRRRRVKTDRRDAEALAQACRSETYRRAHRLSDSARLLRMRVQVRKTLVRSRAKAVSQLRALLAPHGFTVASGSARAFPMRLRREQLPDALRSELLPLVVQIEFLNEQLDEIERQLAQLVAADPAMSRLMTVPGVGPVTAATWVATLDTPDRFGSGRELAAFLGLVPCEWSSSEIKRQGEITKIGPVELRNLLVEDAWHVMTHRKEANEPLRSWALQVAARRGRQKAAVALARRLGRILLACWRNGTTYDAGLCRSRESPKRS